MVVNIPAGKYVLAVSGGVDSMTLLNLLSKKPDLNLIVAHFDHGIRDGAEFDKKLVAEAATCRGLTLVSGRANLGKNASEERARDARYKFLNEVKAKHSADGIITAHHQDDLIETAVINLLRGTGPRGLVAMNKNKKIIRPLLGISKNEIIKYAIKHKIVWREDSTNKDMNYLRNYIRLKLIPKLDRDDRQKLLKNINDISALHDESEELVKELSNDVRKQGVIHRGKFINLPNEIAIHLVTYWLREFGIRDFDKNTLSRLYLTIKTAKPGTQHNVAQGVWLRVGPKTAAFSANR